MLAPIKIKLKDYIIRVNSEQRQLITRDKESRFTMTKESIHQEVIAILIQSYKIHEAKTGRAKRKNRQIQY